MKIIILSKFNVYWSQFSLKQCWSLQVSSLKRVKWKLKDFSQTNYINNSYYSAIAGSFLLWLLLGHHSDRVQCKRLSHMDHMQSLSTAHLNLKNHQDIVKRTLDNKYTEDINKFKHCTKTLKNIDLQ